MFILVSMHLHCTFECFLYIHSFCHLKCGEYIHLSLIMEVVLLANCEEVCEWRQWAIPS